jgi:hypothetical protein
MIVSTHLSPPFQFQLWTSSDEAAVLPRPDLQELWNADTGKLICKQEAVYGSEVSGATGARRFDEKGYLALPPCVWGSASDGLEEPPLLTWDTNLTSIKKTNSTYAHTGEMALWQGRGILV